MEKSDQHYHDEWIGKYLAGEASESEQHELENWAGSDPENLSYYRKLKNLWEVSGKQVSFTHEQLDNKLNNILNKNRNKRSSAGIWTFLQKAAAILLLPLLAAGFFWGRYSANQTGTKLQKIVYNEVFAAYGTRSAVSLSDGSKVWLNSGSSLRYPMRFTSRKREVFLTGEAYFEVESNITRPFLVHTSALIVRATGTKFNVQVYKDQQQAEITLVSGKVSVNRNHAGKTGELVMQLNPDQHMIVDTTSWKSERSQGDSYKYIAWKDGKLIFRNEPMIRVVEKLSRYYNVDIELRGEKLKEYRYRATFEEESFSEILKLLKISSPVDYREFQRKPLPDGTFPKRKVIIFAKGGQPD